MTWSVAKSPRVAEQCDVNIKSINQLRSFSCLNLRSGGRFPARARSPGPKTNQGFALIQNHGLLGFCYAMNMRSKIQFLKNYSRELGKLGMGGAKPTIGFEDYVSFIYVRRCRAERRKGVFKRPAEDLVCL
ncbi:hypothetical protein TNCV_4912031 [Trichonephila clavipes]|nr:hypothetical protein TNCV_4912031 [Trichonephila clavipes]